jgi:hypothetical protein
VMIAWLLAILTGLVCIPHDATDEHQCSQLTRGNEDIPTRCPHRSFPIAF